MISIINAQTKHLSRIVKDMVEVARNKLKETHLSMAEIELSVLVDSAIGLLADDASQARVNTFLEPALTINGDVDRLRQVLLIYLGNAVSYGNGIIEVHARTSNDQVLIEVHDNGDGVPKKYEVTVWERFERGAHTYMSSIQGSGLGLAIARQLIAAHHGNTGHHPSNRLGGACFWLTIPIPPTTGDRHRQLVASKPASLADVN
jgi:signal transduction histidine kinase